MAARGLTVDDVETALNSQNVELPAGSLEAPAQGLHDPRRARLRDARAVRPAADRPARLGRDGLRGAGVGSSAGATAATANGVTGAIRSAQRRLRHPPGRHRPGGGGRPTSTGGCSASNGARQVGLAITRQSQANDLEISDGVRAPMERDQHRPCRKGTKLGCRSTTRSSPRHAIEEVWITMGISLALVALVNFVFLGTWRAAIIPSIVAPICMLSTFIVLAPLGFSINLLTLLALVLAIGLVVDDAIVVVENIQRRIDEGEPPHRGRPARRAAGVLRRGGDHHRADLGVRAADVPAGLHRPAVRRAGGGGRRGGGLLGPAGAQPVADAGVQAAAARRRPRAGWRATSTRAMRQAEELLPRLARGPAGPAHRRGVGASALVVVLVAAGAVGIFTCCRANWCRNEDRGRVDVSDQGPEGAGYDYTLQAAQAGRAGPERVPRGRRGRSLRLLGARGFGGNSFNIAATPACR